MEEDELEASPLPDSDNEGNTICDMIYTSLQLILLKVHSYKPDPASNPLLAMPRPLAASASSRPTLLHPIVELLQYRVFTSNVKEHFDAVVDGLRAVKIPAKLRFVRVGETTKQLVEMLADSGITGLQDHHHHSAPPPPLQQGRRAVDLTGEAMLRVDER